jgi:hypothetical protein
MFVTHARTLEELRAEFLSDIRRRIQLLDGYSRVIARGALERSRIARATSELNDMHEFWKDITFIKAKARPSAPPPSE